jgi:hypothetical protein
MPYSVRKRGKGYAIIRKSDGKTVGKSKTKKKAKASVRARMAGEKRHR